MAQRRLRVRRLSDDEGRQLQRIVQCGGGKTDRSIVKWRRSMVVLASAGGNSVDAIARLVQTSPDRVREMIHRFNEMGMASLDPRWAGGRPRRITTWFTLAPLETPYRWCGRVPRRPARSRGLRSPREGLRESRESGFHHHVNDDTVTASR